MSVEAGVFPQDVTFPKFTLTLTTEIQGTLVFL